MKIAGKSICLGLALAACHAPSDDTPASADLAPLPGGMVARARILGSVINLEHHSFPGVSVRLCGPPCREVQTNESGIYEIPEVPRGNYSLRVELLGAAAANYGKVTLPLYYFDPQSTPVKTMPPTVLPLLGATQTLAVGRQSVAIDSTLSLAIDADALAFPPDSGKGWLAGVRVPPSLYPDFCLPTGDGRVLAEWALSPSPTTSGIPIDIHISENLGLPARSAVIFMTVDPDTGRPERQGSGKVSDDGKSIDSFPMMGIRRLSWLLVTVPSGGGA